MGSPSSNVKQGQLFLGFDYSNSELDFEFSNTGSRGILDDVDIDLYMGRAGIGVFDGLEIFGRFGVGEIEALGNESAWGAGARATIAESGDTSWGILFQLLSLQADEPGNIGGYTLNGDFDIYEYQLAIGPTFNDTVYFGPFFHFVDGDADLAGYGSVDIEQETEFGLFVGVFWEAWSINSAIRAIPMNRDAFELLRAGWEYSFGLDYGLPHST